jgi:hypothetical protein
VRTSNPTYAKHILDNQYAYGSIEDVMDVLKVQTKGVNVDVQERYQIYRIGK